MMPLALPYLSCYHRAVTTWLLCLIPLALLAAAVFAYVAPGASPLALLAVGVVAAIVPANMLAAIVRGLRQ